MEEVKCGAAGGIGRCMGGMTVNLVTGANGFVGNNLVRSLLAQGDAVRCMVREKSNLRSLEGLPVETVTGDVTNRQSLMAAFDGVDTVYHLAAVIAIAPGREELMEQVNVLGTDNVIEACLEKGIRRLCHVSSSHALHEPGGNTVVDEGQPFDDEQRMVYGRTKARASCHVLASCQRGLDAVIACPTGMIGPNDFRPSESGQSVIDYANARVRTYIPGGYTFVDVRDVADALIGLAEKGRSGEYYLLAGQRITMRELVEIIGDITGQDRLALGVPAGVIGPLATLMTGWARLTKTRTIITTDVVETLRANPVFDATKARNELGFSPRPLHQCLEETLAWFRAHGPTHMA